MLVAGCWIWNRAVFAVWGQVFYLVFSVLQLFPAAKDHPPIVADVSILFLWSIWSIQSIAKETEGTALLCHLPLKGAYCLFKMGPPLG